MQPVYKQQIIDAAADNPRENDKGIKIATPFAGPRPGNAPKVVPRMQPISANVKFSKVRATLKPSIKRSNVSIRIQGVLLLVTNLKLF